MNQIRQTFLDTIPVARSIIASPEAAARWDQPSALREFSVRALAGHLARTVFTVETYLNAPTPTSTDPGSAVEYYLRMVARSDWTDPLSPSNTAIRQRGEDQAAVGHAGLLAELDKSSAHLRDRLRNEPENRLVEVFAGLIIRLDEYLVTRVMELTIHTDDLAVSLGLEPPDLPPAALQATIDLLVEMARKRHGDLAILRALARRERDRVDALRVL
jgi:uncharacterized protein (TIGR03083 family)